METITRDTQQASHPLTGNDVEWVKPFSQEWVTITKAEHIELIDRASYWEVQYSQLKQKFAKAEAESQRKDAKIKDLQNRLFGKKSEKPGSAKSEKGDNPRIGIVKALFSESYRKTTLLLSALMSITWTSRHAYWPGRSDNR